MLEKKTYPKESGVYIFKDAGNHILYIGKAKNLHNRISSYFFSNDHKVHELLQQAFNIETIITSHEEEALLLEAQLIQKHQPPFNRMLKAGNPYIYIFFSDEKIPKISIERVKKNKGKYFGPFLTKKEARIVFDYLLKTFQLQLCSKKIESGCLQYHIGLCAGNCKKDFDLEFYKTRFNLAKLTLHNQHKEAQQQLQQEIKTASAHLNFERAQHLATFQENLEKIIHKLNVLKTTKFRNLVVPSLQKDSNLQLLSSLKRRLGLKNIPYKIDCFDISHMQSTAIVGSCVRFVDGKPDKKNFRHFHIKSLVEQNDYAALAEIVSRRYKDPSNIPDLVIIDGGKGQLNATKHLTGPAETISLAKKEETIFFANSKKSIKLDPKIKSDALILQIRDYAHHFAISFHRKTRKLTF